MTHSLSFLTFRRALALGVAAYLLAARPVPVHAQGPTPTPVPDGPPFALPFIDPPGPATWLYEQHYGNTISAFNYGDVWYQFGQGLHFGVDLEAPCGTPIHAIADGVVAYVDADGFGAGPHNLVLDHPGTGYSSLYGHLLQIPALRRGQEVQRGEEIALSGDPDGTCESRPHLHLEIRSSDYQTAYNPLPYFDVNWHMLASIGPVTNAFEQDLDTPYRWLRLEDQPSIEFSGNILNAFQHPWPPPQERMAPDSAAPDQRLRSLPEDVPVTITPVNTSGWNLGAWWDPADPDAVSLIDAVPEGGSGVFRQPLDGRARGYVGPTPPALPSPDGSILVENAGGGQMRVTRRSDGIAWEVDTGGSYPAVSPDGTRLLWQVVYGNIVPGKAPPGSRVWISALDGSDRRMVATLAGGTVQWLDRHRLLITHRVTYFAETDVSVLDVDAQPSDGEPIQARPLGTFRNLRDVQVSPGGNWIAFYTPFQEDPDASGVYVLRTVPGSTARKLPFFGAYRWRDDRTLYTLSFDLTQDAHALGLANAVTGTHRWLTDPAEQPIRVANGDWSVAPDGDRLVYIDPTDYGLYLITIGTE